jgi:hypothetical protein
MVNDLTEELAVLLLAESMAYIKQPSHDRASTGMRDVYMTSLRVISFRAKYAWMWLPIFTTVASLNGRRTAIVVSTSGRPARCSWCRYAGTTLFLLLENIRSAMFLCRLFVYLPTMECVKCRERSDTSFMNHGLRSSILRIVTPSITGG